MTVQNDLVSNNPPISELLAEETAALAKRRDELLAAVGRVPVPLPDRVTAEKTADLARMLAACIAAATEAHKERKAPYLADGRAVDKAYKHDIADPLDAVKDALATELAIFQSLHDIEQLRGDLGSVSSLREEWDYKIHAPSIDDIDIKVIWPYIEHGALVKAIRAFIKDGGRELKGVRIYKNPTVTIR